MAEIEIEVRVYCECGERLEEVPRKRRDLTEDIGVYFCGKCLEKAKDEAYEKGYQLGYDDGLSEGKNE